VWLPNLVWQAQHGWPQVELAGDTRDEYRTVAGTVELVGFQVLMLNPLGGVLAFVGIVSGLRRPAWAFFRPVPVAYLFLLAGFGVAGGKSYYLLGLLPPPAAAGSVVVAQRWSSLRLRLLTVAVAVTALFPVPALLPVLPADTLDASFYPALAEDGLETIGWPDVVSGVRDVVATLPPAQRRTAVVIAQNYGEAGALEWYGGTPPVFSGHNGSGDWGPPRSRGPVVYVGYLAGDQEALTGCQQAATLRTGVNNEEDGAGVWVCDGPVGSWAQAWQRLRHLSA
jgi:hypothetical protein